MRQINALKKLAGNRPVAGICAALPFSSIVEMASQVGYDFIIIDSEHGQMTLESTIDMIRASGLGTAEPMVRVPGKDADLLKRMLNTGATSFMIPTVDKAQQASAIVSACRYPPLGWRRCAAPAVRGLRYGLDAGYADWAHEKLFLCLQIESQAAVANAETISTNDGVDMLLIGSRDLSGPLGVLGQTAHPEVVGALVKAAAEKHGATLDTIPRPGTSTADLGEDGYLLGSGAVDIMMVRDAAIADTKAFGAANNQT